MISATPPPIATCPFAHKSAPVQVQSAPMPAAETVDVERDIAPCHDWLAEDRMHKPVPTVAPGAWQNAKHYDVVVVGAGMSGLHTAWRLKGCDGSAAAKDTPDIAIFEQTHHVGGRARSVAMDGAKIPIDLGAMRFSPQLHPLVSGLADHFKFETRVFPVSGDQNLQYFRGVRLTNKQVADDPTQLPFHLTPEEQGKSPSELLAKAIEAVVPHFRSFTAEQWQDAKKNTMVKMRDGSSLPLYELGLQNVLSLTLSKEAIALVQAENSYHRNELNWDAGQALENLSENYVPNVVYKTPVDGMKAFPEALAADLDQTGTPINTEETLRQVDYDADKKQFHLIFESLKGDITPIVCDKLVLAMPKAPLETLVENSPVLRGTTLDKNLDKVTPLPMTRIYMAFDKPWWNDQGIQGGRSITDLPLNQVYYYNSPGDTHPFLQSYTDGDKAAVFAGLQNPAEPGSDIKLCVSPQLGVELQHELETLHGHPIPAPVAFLYKNWSDRWFGGATHAWNAGSKPFETAESMIAPVANLPLYVCGEAFSTTQGWIEGALQTSEKVLAKMGKAPTTVR